MNLSHKQNLVCVPTVLYHFDHMLSLKGRDRDRDHDLSFAAHGPRFITPAIIHQSTYHAPCRKLSDIKLNYRLVNVRSAHRLVESCLRPGMRTLDISANVLTPALAFDLCRHPKCHVFWRDIWKGSGGVPVKQVDP